MPMPPRPLRRLRSYPDPRAGLGRPPQPGRHARPVGRPQLSPKRCRSLHRGTDCGRHRGRPAREPDVRPPVPRCVRQRPVRSLAVALGRRGGVRHGAGLAGRRSALPAAVALYIGAAYWFTASTSFANPAVTIARSRRPSPESPLGRCWPSSSRNSLAPGSSASGSGRDCVRAWRRARRCNLPGWTGRRLPRGAGRPP
jgi:hypothetical protein